QPTAKQEVCDLGAPVIVDQRIPVEVAPLLGIFMLIERGAVEASEAVRIVGEVSRDPIQNDGESLAVAFLDQGGEIGRSAEATGRRKKSGRLIAPGSVEGMLADRQKSDVGEPNILCVSRQLLCQLAIIEPTPAVSRMPPP